ncbi:MAG: hypothetical protein WCA07_11820 [Gloeobacterales cyanobacterium]
MVEQSEEFSSGLEVDVLAASLQLGLRESKDLLEFLAKKLEGPLAEQTTVRRGGWFLSKDHPVEDITLRFDECQYQISRERQGLCTAKVMKVVRGVVLKTTEVSVEEWLQSLAQELAHQAERSSATRQALSRFILE